jgi:hypothetical protein
MISGNGLGSLGRITTEPGSGSQKTLTDGSRVAVVGAGPAGSFFSYFLLKMARTMALDVTVDVYEPRRFCERGPAGCNHCGGIVSESLVQRLATEGIALPDDVVQRGIESYTLHMDIGDVKIATPVDERRIAAKFRRLPAAAGQRAWREPDSPHGGGRCRGRRPRTRALCRR